MAPNLALAGSGQAGRTLRAGGTNTSSGKQKLGAPRHTLQTRFFFPFGRHPACPFQSSSLLSTPCSPLPQAGMVPARPSRPTSLRQGLCSAGQKHTHRQDLPASPAFPPTHTGCPPPAPHSPVPGATLPTSPSPPVLGGRVPKPALSDTPTQNVLPSQPKPVRFPPQSPQNRGAGPSWFTEGRATGKGGCTEEEGAGVPKKPGSGVTKMGEVRSHPGRDRLGSQRLRVPRREGSGNQEGQLEWGGITGCRRVNQKVRDQGSPNKVLGSPRSTKYRVTQEGRVT